MAASGFDQARLGRITGHLEKHYIEPGKIAGCQVAVARHGHLAYHASLGMRDRERGLPMADDTIFRVYSMTKPITSVALMQLYERGMFQLNDPVHRAIPQWRDHEVYVRGEGERIETRPPEAPMTFRHVLGHTAGLSYGGTNHPVDWVDPVEDLSVVFMTHLMPSATFNFRGQLKNIIYSAIVD